MRDAVISAALLRVCGPCSSEQGQGELEVAQAQQCPPGGVSRGPAFQRVLLLFLLSEFEHLNMKAVVVSQNILPASELGAGELKGAFSDQKQVSDDPKL